jgi:pimeloyl-ACP methyl ester carboxylesterase
LHGGPAANAYSDWFAAELAGWDALRYTQRGVAPSLTEGPFTIEQHVSDALAVLDQCGVAAATVLGHSWGGYLAMQLAARAPGRVNALVLADTLGAVGDGGLAGFGAELTARATPEALARFAELDELSTTGKAEKDAVALESFRLDWPGLPAPRDTPASEPEMAASVGGDIDRWGQGRLAARINSNRPARSGGIGEIQVNSMAGPARARQCRPLWRVADNVDVPPMQVRRQFAAAGEIDGHSWAPRNYI